MKARRRRRHLWIGPGLTAGLVAGCLFLAGPLAAAAPLAGGQVRPARGPVVPGEAIVRFEPGVSGAERREARRGASAELAERLIVPRLELVEVDGPVASAVRRLERQADVAYAQPNYRYQATAVEAPNDSFFGQLWGLSDPALPDPGVSALEAWEEAEGAGQVIAVVDTGVDLTHPDLGPNLWTNSLEDLGLDGVDEDLNGKADDVHGYDFVDDDGDPDDYEFHGTHVAGTAAAVADNGQGIAGVAPGAEIMAVRVLDGDGGGSTADIADGIAYAAENGADVINLSLGGPADEGFGDKAMSDAVSVAAAEDAVVVAAAGNEGADNDAERHTPCALPNPNLICVAALNQSGALAGFSNYGAKTVDIMAPGTSTLSAKVDYGAPLFSDGFETNPAAVWGSRVANGGVPWGVVSSKAASGAQSATDSPGGAYGAAVDPNEFAVSELLTDNPVDLTGERGCRLHFRAMYETEEFFDLLAAGAADEDFGDFAFFDGASPGYPSTFSGEEASISDLDGEPDVHPIFGILSDESDQRDGAHVDDMRVICRDETYVNAIASGAESDLANAGNYIRFQGTSMATPHVSGVVALVRAAAPGLTALEAIEAVLDGASPIPVADPARRTRTEGIADACQAIAVATGADFEAECPGSSGNAPPPQPPEPPAPPPNEPPVGGTPPAPPPGPLPPLPPPPDVLAPNTLIAKRPAKVVPARGRTARVVFRFRSDEAGVSFLCRVDRAPFRPCGARLVRRFRLGRHVLRVVAMDAGGNVDPTAAVFRFRVARKGG
ncbi:MAG TPA: S8 family serine peptidase [Solirubrobacterales bacterium]|nr:S8 family serine peptidase [Solirubrobacterales bacterium]